MIKYSLHSLHIKYAGSIFIKQEYTMFLLFFSAMNIYCLEKHIVP